MKTWEKVCLCVCTLILIAWIVCVWCFIYNEKKITKYSTYCWDKIRQELWEYVENVSMPDANVIDWVYIYTWSVSYEWVDYNFFCKVSDKYNVDLELDVKEWDVVEPQTIDDINEEENIADCNRYFDGCNRCTKQDDWERICTEEACEEYQEAYCADEQYSEFLEDIKSSWEQPQGKNNYPEETPEEANVLDITDKTMDAEYLINLTIWDKTFDVVLENNSSTRALYEKLKEWYVVINAKEYWWFEKVWSLWFDLPREDKQITTEAWDIVLYNWNQISLFYDSNSWSYTKLWKVMNKESLKEALWDWDITLTFSLKK